VGIIPNPTTFSINGFNYVKVFLSAANERIIAGPGGMAAASCSEGSLWPSACEPNFGRSRMGSMGKVNGLPKSCGLDGLLCCADEPVSDLSIPASHDRTPAQSPTAAAASGTD
jgi:hypothetical protein